MPLALVRLGMVDRVEIWHHHLGGGQSTSVPDGAFLTRRTFAVDEATPPFSSRAMLMHIATFGPPRILCVLGLGVDMDILEACKSSFRIYNSIDAPALRVPESVSAQFDLVLTGSPRQSAVVQAAHPDKACAIMPIGPEFADPKTFRPLDLPKEFDIVYVAAAQPYKRHDILFDALVRLPRSIRALCVFGYGEDADALRLEADTKGLDVSFVGPPGVPFAEVNRLMNLARMGVVCGVDDGAPAILTEYMLAGLPVLANDKLACGLQFITPDTGQTASADGFADGITAMLNDLDTFQPRKTVLENWTWPHSGARLAGLIEDGIRRKEALSTFIDTDRNGGLAALAPPVSTSQNRTLSAIRYRKDLGPMSSQPIGSSQRMGSAGQSKVKPPLLCFSHLRWDFVVQRPQHLMRLFAAEQAVWFWEEHIGCDHPLPYLEHHHFPADNVTALRPRLPHWWNGDEVEQGLRQLLDQFVASVLRERPVLWFYTPLALPYARHLECTAVVHDCMDELSAFDFADGRLKGLEQELLGLADVVFTGGRSLHEARRGRHDDIHLFPSAVDAQHFQQARGACDVASDLKDVPGPRLGYFGVIDERVDLVLLRDVAAARPDWSFVMVGPVVKIDPSNLPHLPNIHWLGSRSYSELPAYLAGWNVALMPFAMNKATRYISPTKTPEYLAGGRPVVSTLVPDVVASYGHLDGVIIADTAQAFIAGCEEALALPTDGEWLTAADRVVAEQSWTRTQAAMSGHIERVSANRSSKPASPSLRRHEPEILVVGAGFAGAVLAERLAADGGKRVLVIDKRDHIAGNAFDHQDAAGVLVHRYGPHIFHTNAQSVVDYLSRFTQWRPYEHRVLAEVDGKLLPIPINRTTLNELYGLSLSTDEEAGAYLASSAEPVDVVKTSRDVVVNAVGQHLYETFFQGYTRKQWGLDPSQLDKSVTSRVPTRTSTDDRYFQDTFQAMPADGYTAMFERLLDHPNITVETGVDYDDVRDGLNVEHTVYTGPVDAFFGHCFGRLPYRCLSFRHETHDRNRFQPVACVNQPLENVPHTRITEYKHLTGQTHPQTSISYEYPSDEGDPYYPVPREENQVLYRRYEALAAAIPDVSFVGRLATYRYYNMDQVVAQALTTYDRLQKGTGRGRKSLQPRTSESAGAAGSRAAAFAPSVSEPDR